MAPYARIRLQSVRPDPGPMMKLVFGNARSSKAIVVILRLVVWAGLSLFMLGGIAGAGAYVYLSRDLPEIPPFESIRFGTASSISDERGLLLGEVFSERRYLTPIDRIPDVLIKAVLSSEDERFFEHSGTDLRGIARALFKNLMAGKVREGASTITQQVARSLLLSGERSFKRKAREGIIARRLEDIYSKDQILAIYLNLIYLGEGCYGVEAASRMYFGKTAMDLTIAEAATIAALPQSPSSVTPLRAPEELTRRRDRVINRMQENGSITPEMAAAALQSRITVIQPGDNLRDRAPYMTMESIAAIKPWTAKSGKTSLLAGGGSVRVETPVDMGLQLAADRAAWRGALEMSMRQGWSGPIATLRTRDFERFLERNGTWLASHGSYAEPGAGNPLLALVTSVEKDGADISLTADRKGRVPLDLMKWATPYTSFDDKLLTEKRGSLSLDGRLKDATTALEVGDVVIVMPDAPGDSSEGPARYRLAQFPRVQTAIIAMDHRTGYVKALSGGWDFDESQYNRTKAVRQTGSVVKPVYYSRAYDLGIPPSTVLSGAPFREGSWNPVGSSSTEDMTLYMGLTKSENRISLRAYKLVLDIDKVDGLNEWGKRLGLKDPFKGFPAEALGIEQRPADVLKGYAVFASGGLDIEPVYQKLVIDDAGGILADNRSPRDPTVGILEAVRLETTRPFDTGRRLITREAAYITAENLRNVAREGTGSAARKLGRPVFGKTGTLPYDVWFAGWTHEMTAISWIGQDVHTRFLGRNRARGNVYASSTALPMWIDFMGYAAGGREPVDDLQPPPPGIIFVEVDPQTGLLARDEGIEMPHIEGTEPVDLSPLPIETLPLVESAFF